jgi:hypothetical protein
MAAVSKGLFGGQLPWGMIECGAGIGAAIIALDEYLKASGAKWRTPVLAAAVGIYLPLDLTTPIFLGGLLTWFVERRLGVVKDDHDAKDRVHRKGVLFSAGLITGEALIGIFMAIPIVASGTRPPHLRCRGTFRDPLFALAPGTLRKGRRRITFSKHLDDVRSGHAQEPSARIRCRTRDQPRDHWLFKAPMAKNTRPVATTHKAKLYVMR